MQAIRVHYVGPTKFKGARLIATAAAGKVTIGYPHHLPREEAPAAAMTALASKMGWHGEWFGGELPDGSTVYIYRRAVDYEHGTAHYLGTAVQVTPNGGVCHE